MLKCIECDEVAEYIYKGNSVCSKHLEYSSKDGKVNEAMYFTLLKDYIGRESTLNYFWIKCLDKYPNLSFESKSKWLRRINKIVVDFKIGEKVLSDSLNLAIKRDNYDIGFLIQVIKHKQAVIDKKESEANRNSDVYEQIAKNA